VILNDHICFMLALNTLYCCIYLLVITVVSGTTLLPQFLGAL